MTAAATSTSAPAVNFGLSVVAIRRKFGSGANRGKCAQKRRRQQVLYFSWLRSYDLPRDRDLLYRELLLLLRLPPWGPRSRVSKKQLTPTTGPPRCGGLLHLRMRR